MSGFLILGAPAVLLGNLKVNNCLAALTRTSLESRGPFRVLM